MPFTAKPLSGLKVIELGTLIAGPFASRICGEFGADVIKIESPNGGDPLRKWRKLTQNAVADRAGISQGHLSDIESNRRKLSSETAASIAKALDVPLEWLAP